MHALLEADIGGFEAELACPACGSTYLHHAGVDVFMRDEDSEHGTHVRVCGGLPVVDTNLAANPSPRRHGLTIE